MNFGQVEEATRTGKKAARKSWNGKGQFILRVEKWWATDLLASNGYDEKYKTTPFLALKTVQNTLVPWTPSQTDQLADDWEIID